MRIFFARPVMRRHGLRRGRKREIEVVFARFAASKSSSSQWEDRSSVREMFLTPELLKGPGSMWRLFLIAVLFALPTLAWSENIDAADPQFIIHQALFHISEGAYDAENEKQVRGLGDAATVAFTKEIGDRRMTWTDIENFLFLVHEAFAAPYAIQNQGDRKPTTSLFVVQTLNQLPLADELKRAVVDTRVFLEELQ